MKALFYGVGAAALVGLLTGGAMKPDLEGDGPEGPQILALSWAEPTVREPFDLPLQPRFDLVSPTT